MAAPFHTFRERGRATRCVPGLCPGGCRLEVDCSAVQALASIRQLLQGVGSFSTAPKGEMRWPRGLRPNPDPIQAHDGNETQPFLATRSRDQVQSGESRTPRIGWHGPGKKKDLG